MIFVLFSFRATDRQMLNSSISSVSVEQKKYLCSAENEKGIIDHRVLKQKWVDNIFIEFSLPFENYINTSSCFIYTLQKVILITGGQIQVYPGVFRKWQEQKFIRIWLNEIAWWCDSILSPCSLFCVTSCRGQDTGLSLFVWFLKIVLYRCVFNSNLTN